MLCLYPMRVCVEFRVHWLPVASFGAKYRVPPCYERNLSCWELHIFSDPLCCSVTVQLSSCFARHGVRIRRSESDVDHVNPHNLEQKALPATRYTTTTYDQLIFSAGFFTTEALGCKKAAHLLTRVSRQRQLCL